MKKTMGRTRNIFLGIAAAAAVVCAGATCYTQQYYGKPTVQLEAVAAGLQFNSIVPVDGGVSVSLANVSGVPLSGVVITEKFYSASGNLLYQYSTPAQNLTVNGSLTTQDTIEADVSCVGLVVTHQ